jgi:hypothetical protein
MSNVYNICRSPYRLQKQWSDNSTLVLVSTSATGVSALAGEDKEKQRKQDMRTFEVAAIRLPHIRVFKFRAAVDCRVARNSCWGDYFVRVEWRVTTWRPPRLYMNLLSDGDNKLARGAKHVDCISKQIGTVPYQKHFLVLISVRAE